MLLIIMKIADFCISLIHPRICGNFKLPGGSMGVGRLCRGGDFSRNFWANKYVFHAY